LTEIVATNRLEWMRLEMETVSFPSETAAREAILCVREDGLSLYDVAALSHRMVSQTTIALEDVHPQHRDQLLAAEPGRVLGPLAVDGRFDVTALISRATPALTDPTVAARARRRIGLRVIPYVFILYIIAFLDRVNVGYAALQMADDLGFSAEVFGFGAGIFFFGYVILEIPGSVIVERWSARKWIARIMISWGILAIMMAFVRTFVRTCCTAWSL
jgi:hypothetical protein